jgi:hypothetical protein
VHGLAIGLVDHIGLSFQCWPFALRAGRGRRAR